MTDIEIIETKLYNYSKRVLYLPRSILCVNLSEQMRNAIKKVYPHANYITKTDDFADLEN